MVSVSCPLVYSLDIAFLKFMNVEAQRNTALSLTGLQYFVVLIHTVYQSILLLLGIYIGFDYSLLLQCFSEAIIVWLTHGATSAFVDSTLLDVPKQLSEMAGLMILLPMHECSRSPITSVAFGDVRNLIYESLMDVKISYC